MNDELIANLTLKMSLQVALTLTDAELAQAGLDGTKITLEAGLVGATVVMAELNRRFIELSGITPPTDFTI